MNNHNTHLLRHYTGRSELSRISDGMLIAIRDKCGVAFGTDPRQQQYRVFIDETHAKAFLRRIADIDQAETVPDGKARIEEQVESNLMPGAMVRKN